MEKRCKWKKITYTYLGAISGEYSSQAYEVGCLEHHSTKSTFLNLTDNKEICSHCGKEIEWIV